MTKPRQAGVVKTPAKKSFGTEADKFLQDFYKRFGSSTTEEKTNLLQEKLRGTCNFYSLGSGDVTAEQKLACLEYEFLEKCGQINLIFA